MARWLGCAAGPRALRLRWRSSESCYVQIPFYVGLCIHRREEVVHRWAVAVVHRLAGDYGKEGATTSVTNNHLLVVSTFR